ncbi:MAG: hypothetical protein KAS32_15925 [Candidatus Peribacteraceae bacterium]|nr:hypothetical protein [Candidatus Peribacteraceae bacterium]
MTWMFVLQYIVAPLTVAFIIWMAGSTVWLVSQIIAQKYEMKKFRLEISQIQSDYKRHQFWAEDMQKSISRMDRNVVLLCAQNGIKYEEAKS